MAKKAGAAKKAGKPVDEEVEEDGVEEPKNASSKAVESGKLNEQVVGALLEGLTCDGHRIKVTKLAGSTSGADVEFTVKNIPYSLEVKSSGAFEFGQCKLTCIFDESSGKYRLAYRPDSESTMFFRDIIGITEERLRLCWEGEVPSFLHADVTGVPFTDTWTDQEQDEEFERLLDKSDKWKYVSSEKWTKLKTDEYGKPIMNPRTHRPMSLFSDERIMTDRLNLPALYYGLKSPYIQLMGFGTFATMTLGGKINDPLHLGVQPLQLPCFIRLRVKKSKSAKVFATSGQSHPAGLQVCLSIVALKMPTSEIDITDPSKLPDNIQMLNEDEFRRLSQSLYSKKGMGAAKPAASGAAAASDAAAASADKPAAKRAAKAVAMAAVNDEEDVEEEDVEEEDEFRVVVERERISAETIYEDGPDVVMTRFNELVAQMEDEYGFLYKRLGQQTTRGRVSVPEELNLLEQYIKNIKDLIPSIGSKAPTKGLEAIRRILFNLDKINELREQIKITYRKRLMGTKMKKSKRKSRRSHKRHSSKK